MQKYLFLLLVAVFILGAAESSIPQNRHINFHLVDSLSLLIKTDSTNHTLINQRGEYWLELQKYPKALDDFQRAIKLETLNPLYNKNRGDAYFGLNDELRAMESYNRAIRLGKKNLIGYKGKFLLLMVQRKHEKAKKLLDKMYTIDEKNPELYALEGFWLRETGDVENAFVMFKKANTLQPELKLAHYNLAMLYTYSFESQKGLGHIDRVLEISPHDIPSLIFRTTIHIEDNNYDKALTDCNTLLAYDSTNPWHWVNRGECYLKFGKMYECGKDLEKAIALDSTNVEALQLQAKYFRFDGKLSNAVRCYNKLIPIFPKDDSLYFYRADCRNRLGDFYNASKDYDKAISLNKNSTLYYNNCGANYSHMGWSKDAIKMYNVVLWLDSTETHIYCNIGTEYFHAQDYEKAEFYLKKFLTTVKSDTDQLFLDLAQDMMAKLEEKKKEKK